MLIPQLVLFREEMVFLLITRSPFVSFFSLQHVLTNGKRNKEGRKKGENIKNGGTKGVG